MSNFYYTFGSDSKFPYRRGDYVLVRSNDLTKANKAFMRKYPHPFLEDVVNCAFIYTEDQFDEIRNKYYKGTEPVDVIDAESILVGSLVYVKESEKIEVVEMISVRTGEYTLSDRKEYTRDQIRLALTSEVEHELFRILHKKYIECIREAHYRWES